MASDLISAVKTPEIIGYASKRSVAAGSTIEFYISSRIGRRYDGQLVRLISPDIGPVGPSAQFIDVDSPLNGTHDGILQEIKIGSYLEISGPIKFGNFFSLIVMTFPTLVDSRRQTIMEIVSSTATRLRIVHSSTHGLTAEILLSGSVISSTSVAALPQNSWTEVRLDVNLESSLMTITTTSAAKRSQINLPRQSSSVTVDNANPINFEGSRIIFAASYDDILLPHCPVSVFNGKLENPHLLNYTPDGLDSKTIAEWDFSIGINTNEVFDIGPLGLNGRLNNLPTRGVRGHKWSGSCLSWVNDPEGYAAIHFHDDDLADVEWQVSHRFEVPSDTKSGCYAFRLSPIDESSPAWFIPFAIRPPIDTTCSKTAFILPTTTYGAYANMNLRVLAQFNELAHGRLTVLDSTDLLMLEMPELGKSTYDVHNDGSPVVYSTMNRPVTNFRPNGRMYKFCQDMMIVDWLEAVGIDVDVITDDDIQRDGSAAIAAYEVIITGSHPEYVTRRQLDALQQFTDSGGRLLYIGGNGFYSAAEVPALQPDVVEVRRPGQDNLWRVNHTEGIFSTSGLPAGLWRNIGRPENNLVGVGFITQGFDQCTFYRRNESSRDARVSWIFEGLDDDELIGDFGILQGGAAGYEIDRHDFTKGSPTHSVVVASSSDHSPVYDLMVSSILDTLPQHGPSPDPIRADMVFFETNNGGAVFSVGSIAWSGSLSHNHYDNNVSRVTLNVVKRFLRKEPFLV